MKDGVRRAGYLPKPKEPSSSQLLSRNIEGPRRSPYCYGESPEQRRQRLEELRKRYSKLPETSFANYDLGNKELPAYKHKAEILDTLSENKISWLCGPTGSGKTTQTAQYALERFDRVVVLMPRRVIVDNVTEYVEQSLRGQLGKQYPDHLVGKIHGRTTEATPDTRLCFMTAATFTKKLEQLSGDWHDEKTLVLVDEIHEANLEMEFATALAAKSIENTDKWHMAFSSATPDTEVSQTMYEDINGSELPVVTIEGRPHEIDITEDKVNTVSEAYLEYGKDSKKSLVFVEGVRSIEETIASIKRHTRHQSGRIRFFKLHSGISEAARREIFTAEPAEDESFVIVSTSAGQSGITIPEVDLVLSNGLTKSKEIGEEGAEGLPPRLCTQAELMQQAGRGGRDIDGAKFVLARPISYGKIYLPEELKGFYDITSREQHIPPEIYHTNIVRNVLSAIHLNGDFEDLNRYLMHPVASKKVIQESYDLLETLEAIDGEGQITKIGEFMDNLPLSPELSRALAEMIRTGGSLREVLALSAIAASISGGGFTAWHQPKELFQEFVSPDTTDDFFAEYDAFLKTRKIYDGHYTDGRAYLANGIDPNKADNIHYQFSKICRRLSVNPNDIDMGELNSEEKHNISVALVRGFQELLYTKAGSRRIGRTTVNQYTNIHTGERGISEYEISSYSLARRMGMEALKLVVAFPWWYDAHDGRRHTLNTILPVTKDQVAQALSGSAVPESLGDRIAPNGDLVHVAQLKVGSLILGPEQQQKIPAATDEQIALLVNAMKDRANKQVRVLFDLQHQRMITKGQLRQVLEGSAVNSHNVHEAEANVWAVVQEVLTSGQQEAFYGQINR
mgnify:CR=1 FL=1